MGHDDDRDDATGGPSRSERAGAPHPLAEAWEGWLKSVSLILACVLAYVLYKFDLVSESLSGIFLVAAIVLGAFASGALPAWDLARDRRGASRALFAIMTVTWLASTGYPALRAAIPGPVLAEAWLQPGQTEAKLDAGRPGPYALTVSGRFKQAGMADAEASYTIKAEGGGTDEAAGSLKRALVRLRASRRGGTATSLQEHTEQVHRLGHVSGPAVTLSTDAVDDQLEGGLRLALRAAGPDPRPFLALGLVAFVLALWFDLRLVDHKGKARTALTAALGAAWVFAVDFPSDATPHSLVRPAVGALFLGLVTGGLGGFVLSALARAALGPKASAKR